MDAQHLCRLDVKVCVKGTSGRPVVFTSAVPNKNNAVSNGAQICHRVDIKVCVEGTSRRPGVFKHSSTHIKNSKSKYDELLDIQS